MTNSTKSLVLAAAVSGLFGGTPLRVNAQPTTNGAPTATAGFLLAQTTPDPTQALL
jgi:hypothetical protein